MPFQNTVHDHELQKPLNVLSVSEISVLRYLHAYAIEYLDKTGKPRLWELVSRGNQDRVQAELFEHKSYTDGTMIFATDPQRKSVILLREFRVSANQFIYMLPAGLVDPGEPIETAAIREFKEETGLDFVPIHIDREQYVSIGIINEKINIAYGYYSGDPSTRYQDDNEYAEIHIVNREAVQTLLKTESFCVRSALLLESFFQLHPFLHTRD